MCTRRAVWTASRRVHTTRVHFALPSSSCSHWPLALFSRAQLGVIGDAAPSERGVLEASDILRTIYTDLAQTSNKKLIVVSSWVAEGVSLVAFREARAQSLPTVGFACREAKQSDADKFDCDEVYVVGRQPGDELSSFVQFVDGLVLIGGGIREKHLFSEFTGAKWKFSIGQGDIVAGNGGAAATDAQETVRNVRD